MSAFYRCDLCSLEVPHPGMDTEQECILLPDGWKSDGEDRDFCPAHSLRIKDGEFVHFDREADETVVECGDVVAYNDTRREYEVLCWIEEAAIPYFVTADHLEQENPSVYWVPR